MKKMTIIGGGSVRAVFFANSLARRADELNITTLCLYDIDPEKLKIIGTLAKHAAAKVNPKVNVVLETDLEKAVTGTDYFVTTIRVGNDKSRVADEEISFENGVLGQETTGAGGFFMACRSIPVLAEYCEVIKTLAPSAWIFNFTNPSGLVTQALRSMGYDRVIGICDTPSSTKLRISQAMGYENNKLYMEFFGLNHLSWAAKAEYEGQDVMQTILNAPDITEKVGELAMFDPALIRLIGHIPNEYLYYYYYRDQVVENVRKSGGSRGRSVAETNIEMMRELRAMDVEANPEEGLRTYLRHMYEREANYMKLETSKQVMHVPAELVMPEGDGYAGIAIDFAHAVESGKEQFVVLSVPNEGNIDGLADDDVVEITCRVDKNGAHPVKIGTVDEGIFALIKAVKAFERLSVEAIRTRSLTSAVRALIAHPLIGSYPVAKKLIEDYRKQQPEFMSDWAE